MKTQSMTKMMMILAAIGFLGTGCSTKDSSVAPATEAPTVRTGDTGSGDGGTSSEPDDSSWGTKAYLDVENKEDFASFAGMPADEIFEERIYLDLDAYEGRFGVKYYQGEVKVAFNTGYVEGGFGSNPGNVVTNYFNFTFEALPYNADELSEGGNPGTYAEDGIRFNKVYNKNGDTFFVAFFEEPGFEDFAPWGWNANAIAGSVLLVIESIGDEGLSGSIYFKNYGFTYASKPTYTRCWDIKRGPFECRDFLNGQDEIDPRLDFIPQEFTKLGSFYNLAPEDSGIEEFQE
ncbi:MAG: hypothetical protein AB8E15_09535 [Bdellovibrionales bacterium]